MVKPRIRSLPAALGSRGGELVALAESLGYRLDGWQRLAANDILATDDEGNLSAFEAALVVSRQCGKSLLGELYALLFALLGEHVMYTSHRADSSKEIFRRLFASLPDEWEAVPTYTNGKEQVRFPGGGIIYFRTRGPRVGRGFVLDKIVVDECQVCDREALDAVMPTLRTRPGGQVLYLGCAPNAKLNPYANVLHDLRQRGIAGDGQSLCYLEWSAEARDAEGNELPGDELPEGMLDDERLWAQATPAFESGRITLERMRTEREALDPVSFAVEYLSVAIWPVSDALGGGPISVEDWNGLADPESELDPAEQIPEVIVSFDVSPSRQVSVCVVGRRADGLLHLDFAGRFAGMTKAVQAISAIYEREDVDVRQIVADGEPQCLDLLARLRQEYVPERVLRSEGASKVGVQSCGALIDLVNERRFRHRGQLELVEALRAAVVKTLTDSWVYSRSRSRADVSPLLAAAAGLWAADLELAAAGEAAALFIH